MLELTIVNEVEVIEAGKLSVAELVQRIQDRARRLNRHAQLAAKCAFEIGQLLIEAKSQVPHGEWEAWLSEHCNLAPRTARAYMRLAKELPKLSEAERQRVTVLPIREALKAIITDPTPLVKYEGTNPIHHGRTRTDQDRVISVFSKARQKLVKAEKSLIYGMKGSEVEALRKHLEAVLEQLNELQGQPCIGQQSLEVA